MVTGATAPEGGDASTCGGMGCRCVDASYPGTHGAYMLAQFICGGGGTPGMYGSRVGGGTSAACGSPFAMVTS